MNKLVRQTFRFQSQRNAHKTSEFFVAVGVKVQIVGNKQTCIYVAFAVFHNRIKVYKSTPCAIFRCEFRILCIEYIDLRVERFFAFERHFVAVNQHNLCRWQKFVQSVERFGNRSEDVFSRVGAVHVVYADHIHKFTRIVCCHFVGKVEPICGNRSSDTDVENVVYVKEIGFVRCPQFGVGMSENKRVRRNDVGFVGYGKIAENNVTCFRTHADSVAVKRYLFLYHQSVADVAVCYSVLYHHFDVIHDIGGIHCRQRGMFYFSVTRCNFGKNRRADFVDKEKVVTNTVFPFPEILVSVGFYAKHYAAVRTGQHFCRNRSVGSKSFRLGNHHGVLRCCLYLSYCLFEVTADNIETFGTFVRDSFGGNCKLAVNGICLTCAQTYACTQQEVFVGVSDVQHVIYVATYRTVTDFHF